jgi:hypothetical protein
MPGAAAMKRPREQRTRQWRTGVAAFGCSTRASSGAVGRPIPGRVNHAKAEFLNPRVSLVARGRLCAVAVCALFGATAGSLFVAHSAGAGTKSNDVSVPITTKQASDGSWLVTVDVSVAGGPTVPVQLDTGSTGLVIDSTVVGKGAHATGQPFSSGYVSGAVNGQIDTGAVSIGGVKSSASTAFSVVPASSSFGKTWANGPIRGILGIAMTDDTSPTSVYSPLLQMPSPYWQGVTVNVAKGQDAKGSLVIGPVRARKHAVALPMSPATPSTYPDGRPAFQKDTTMCWQIGHMASSCGLTDMDLGDPSPAVNTNFEGLHDGETFDAGQAVSITSPSGSAVWSFTTGSNVSVPNVLRVSPLSTDYTEFNTSIGFFFARSLALDVTGKQYLVSTNPLNH